MSETMQAVVLDGAGGISLQEKLIPTPGPQELLVRVLGSGLCGTDLHILHGGYPHASYPLVPGHEFAGEVVATGAEVTRFAEGDLVCADPNRSCGRCRWCRIGALNLCVDAQAYGINLPGACAEYLVVHEDVSFGLPEGVDPIVGSLIEPLSCVLHAAERTPGWPGADVGVYGAGPIGLMGVAVAKALGAGRVTVFEPQAGRRDMALRIGADEACATKAEHERDAGFDIALEASGHPDAVQSAVDCLGLRGRLLQMGVTNEATRMSVSPYTLYAKELMLIGSCSVADAYPAAVRMMPALADTLRPLVTDILPLDRYADAVERMRAPDSIKVQVVGIVG